MGINPISSPIPHELILVPIPAAKSLCVMGIALLSRLQDEPEHGELKYNHFCSFYVPQARRPQDWEGSVGCPQHQGAPVSCGFD